MALEPDPHKLELYMPLNRPKDDIFEQQPPLSLNTTNFLTI